MKTRHIPLIGIIEDDRDLRTILKLFLQEHMMEPLLFDNAESAWRYISNPESRRPDLWVVDIMLPGLWDGLDFIRSLRMLDYGNAVPVLVLTARGREHDVVTGLESGADDYVVKPYRPGELIARIKALLRRVRKRGETRRKDVLTWGSIEVDLQNHVVRRDGNIIPFTHFERIIFEHLVQAHGRAFSRDELLQLIRDDDADISSRTIDVHIRHIRKKLGPYKKWLVTIRNEGYAWRPEMREGEEA